MTSTGTGSGGQSIGGPVTYIKNRAKDALRRVIPAHRRFIRAGESFLADGEREVHELPRLAPPGTTAVDVGAHIGDYTYALCRQLGPSGHVLAIEPLPDLADLLRRATAHLRLPVTVVNCALSSRDGEAELHVPITNGKRAAGFATLEMRNLDGRAYRVPLRRLDDVCRDAPGRISLVKIDVEGHELEVLRGGVKTLRRHRPNLLIEIEQRHSPVPIQQTFDFVTSLGYRGEFLDTDGRYHPLAAFRVAEHQARRLSEPGTGRYVSNFIFLPHGDGQP